MTTELKELGELDREIARLTRERERMARRASELRPRVNTEATWEEANGGRATSILHGGVRHFASGAVDKGQIKLDPPNDPADNLLARLRYHEAWAERLNKDLLDLGKVINGARGGWRATWRWDERCYGPAPDARDPDTGYPDPKVPVRLLRARAQHHLDRLDALMPELAALPYRRPLLEGVRGRAERLLRQALDATEDQQPPRS